MSAPNGIHDLARSSKGGFWHGLAAAALQSAEPPEAKAERECLSTITGIVSIGMVALAVLSVVAGFFLLITEAAIADFCILGVVAFLSFDGYLLTSELSRIAEHVTEYVAAQIEDPNQPQRGIFMAAAKNTLLIKHILKLCC